RIGFISQTSSPGCSNSVQRKLPASFSPRATPSPLPISSPSPSAVSGGIPSRYCNSASNRCSRLISSCSFSRSAEGMLQSLVEAGEVGLAEDLCDDLVPAVEEERRRQALQAEACGHDSLRVEDAWVMPAEAAVERFRGGARVLDVDADDLRLRVRSLEVRKGARFRVAAGAPGRPHVEHDRLPRVR